MKRITPITWTLLALTAGLMMACGPHTQDESSEVVATPNNPRVQKNPEAEARALQAEALFFGQEFDAAEAQIHAAIVMDPTNLRARFYEAALATITPSRGIITRLEPFLRTLSADVARQIRARLLRESWLPSSYLLQSDGREIRNESDLQNYFLEVRDGFHFANEFLRRAEDVDLSLNVSDARGSRVIRIDRYDRKALEISFFAAEVAAATLRLYDLSGAADLSLLFPTSSKIADQDAVQLVRSKTRLGRLLDPSALTHLRELGEDGLEMAKLLLQQKNLLCAAGRETEGNRPGQLFSKGLCVSRALASSLPQLAQGLRGPVHITIRQRYSTVVDVSPFLRGEWADLQSLMPQEFDGCGNATSLPDLSLRGVLPKKDVVRVAQASGTENFLNPSCPFQVRR